MASTRIRAGHLLITCEHGGNRVPRRYRALFAGHQGLLGTHRGYDLGALRLARGLARAFAAPLFGETVTRLLVDLNRSLGHQRLFSEIVRDQPNAERQAIVERYYLPYRHRVEAHIAQLANRRVQVIHVSVHSFTPVLDGEVRTADVGILYDPARRGEAALAKAWQAGLQALDASLRVRRNYPYRGTADGFTTHLRRRFPADAYLGIELEMNQAQVLNGAKHWAELQVLISTSLRAQLLG